MRIILATPSGLRAYLRRDGTVILERSSLMNIECVEVPRAELDELRDLLSDVLEGQRREDFEQVLAEG